MNTNSLISTLVAMVLFGIGCSTTTERSRNAALNIRAQVAQFRVEQQNHLDMLNDQYQKNYAWLITQIIKLSRRETEQGLDLESLRLSDRILEKWESETLPSKVQEAFLQMVQGDYEQLRRAERTLDTIRRQYADQYQEVALQLNLLSKIEANLKTLAQEPAKAKAASAVLAKLYQAYRKTAEEQRKQEEDATLSKNTPK